MEILFKQNFNELSTEEKKAELKKSFKDDLKWALAATILVAIWILLSFYPLM